MVIRTLTKLAVPEEGNCIFASPDYSLWPVLFDQNREKLVLFHNENCRRELIGEALDYTKSLGLHVDMPEDHRNVVATGHQPVWHHCGILAKNVITTAFAGLTGATAVHLVLDHDICDTAMSVAQDDGDGFYSIRSVSLEKLPSGIPFEMRAVADQNQLNEFIAAVANYNCNCCAGAWREINIERRGMAVADAVTKLQANLYEAVGIKVLYLPVSRMSECECFIEFVLSIISDAPNFFGAYNEAIAGQVADGDLDSHEMLRPLKIDSQGQYIELPFWCVLATGQRASLQVRDDHGRFTLAMASNVLGTIDGSMPDSELKQFVAIMRNHNCRLRPKAVSLTLFVRLYLANWFIHGVGGAVYERITDYIISRCYGVTNLKYGIATATMKLPLENSPINAGMSKSQLKNQLRDIEFNPEKFIDEPVRSDEFVVSLIREKRELIQTAQDKQINAAQRKTAWRQLEEVNQKLHGYVESRYERLLKEVAAMHKQAASRKVIENREFFFGLYPMEMLKKLVDSARQI